MWLRDFHVDGLRLDAVHAIFDAVRRFISSNNSSIEVRALESLLRRQFMLIAESDLNRAAPDLPAFDAGGYGLDAQWSDDFHHAISRVFNRASESGYYADFGSLANVAKALTSPYVYDGIYSRHRKRIHGRPAVSLEANRFVVCIQNHDQIGNRAKGERLGHLISSDMLKIASALLMTSAFVPLIFKAKSGTLRARFNTSPTIRIPRSHKRFVKDDAGNSRLSSMPLTKFPIRRPARLSNDRS